MASTNKWINFIRTWPWVKLLLIFGIILVISAPYLFTRITFWDKLDFTKTGAIGDTIGGITAPFVNLIGAILVFFALQAQIQANRLIQGQIENQKKEETIRKKIHYVSEKITLVTNDLNEFSYTRSESIGDQHQLISTMQENVHYKGASAIYKLILDHRFQRKHDETDKLLGPKISEFISLLHIINVLITSIDKEDIPKEDKDFFKSLIAYQYDSKLREPLGRYKIFIETKLNPCPICEQKHSDLDKAISILSAIRQKLPEVLP